MKKLRYLLALMCLFAVLRAQNSYNLNPIPFNPDPFNAGTPTGIATDDVFGGVIPMPFSFCFYDQSYDSLVIGSNGVVTFDLSKAGMFCPFYAGGPIPTSSVSDKSIFSAMEDLNPYIGGSIMYDVRGIAPYRRFVISFFQIPMFACNTVLFTEQVILYETTNVIETHIQDKPFCAGSGLGIHGIQADASTAWAVLGRNYASQWIVSHDGYRFTPSGTCAGPPQADSVNGRVYADYNNNCAQDVGEFPIMNRAVIANGGQYYGWSDANGNYRMGLAPGSYAVMDQPLSPFYASSCLPGGAHNVVLSNTVVNNADFADSTSSICSDISVGIGAVLFRRCRASDIYVTYCNNGSYPDSNVIVTVQLIDSISLDSASMPFVALGANAYAFAVGNLMPGQCGNITLHTGIGCDTAGTIFCVSAVIQGDNLGDCNFYNNQDTDCHGLMAPCDPNEKTVAAQDFATLGYVHNDNIDNNDELVYMIHFQNVGNTWAQDVTIRDTLDAALLPESLEAGAASAPYNYYVNGNEVLFRFENINLPDSNTNEPGSHGFVKFTIQQRPGNPVGTVIHNQASIYFDFEAPVVTNQTVNSILAVKVASGLVDAAQVYPNPGHDQLIVQRQVDRALSFVLYDIAGKEVRRVELSELRTVVPTTDLQAGVYLYRLLSDGQMLEAGKWMKQ